MRSFLWSKDYHMDKILLLMRRLGLRSTYSGYHYLATAVTLTLEDQEYLRNVTKRLYVTIGHQHGVNDHCVEAALRTLITSYWNQNGDKILSRVLGYPLYSKPTASEFISILTDYLYDHPDFGNK